MSRPYAPIRPRDVLQCIPCYMPPTGGPIWLYSVCYLYGRRDL